MILNAPESTKSVSLQSFFQLLEQHFLITQKYERFFFLLYTKKGITIER